MSWVLSPHHRRINVVGTSGSGKSSVARRLASDLGVDYVEMDRLFWRPNWTYLGDEEFFHLLSSELARPGWVLDGNYQRTEPIKWRKVDVVIWVDSSFGRTLWQVTRRAIARVWRGDELWPGTGNRETLGKTFFSRDSIIWWMVTTFARNRRDYAAKAADPKYDHIKFVRLRGTAEIEAFFEAFARWA